MFFVCMFFMHFAGTSPKSPQKSPKPAKSPKKGGKGKKEPEPEPEPVEPTGPPPPQPGSSEWVYVNQPIDMVRQVKELYESLHS